MAVPAANGPPLKVSFVVLHRFLLQAVRAAVKKINSSGHWPPLKPLPARHVSSVAAAKSFTGGHYHFYRRSLAAAKSSFSCSVENILEKATSFMLRLKVEAPQILMGPMAYLGLFSHSNLDHHK